MEKMLNVTSNKKIQIEQWNRLKINSTGLQVLTWPPTGCKIFAKCLLISVLLSCHHNHLMWLFEGLNKIISAKHLIKHLT